MSYTHRHNQLHRQYLQLEITFAWLTQRVWQVLLYGAILTLLAQLSLVRDWEISNNQTAPSEAGILFSTEAFGDS